MTFKLHFVAECDRQDRVDCHRMVSVLARSNHDAAEELDGLGWWVGDEYSFMTCPACRER